MACWRDCAAARDRRSAFGVLGGPVEVDLPGGLRLVPLLLALLEVGQHEEDLGARRPASLLVRREGGAVPRRLGLGQVARRELRLAEEVVAERVLGRELDGLLVRLRSRPGSRARRTSCSRPCRPRERYLAPPPEACAGRRASSSGRRGSERVGEAGDEGERRARRRTASEQGERGGSGCIGSRAYQTARPLAASRRGGAQNGRHGALPRVRSSPKSMDTAEEARDYDAMDHGQVNARFCDDLLAVGRGLGRVLDVGTGTALIPIELCRRAAAAEVDAIDLGDPHARPGGAQRGAGGPRGAHRAWPAWTRRRRRGRAGSFDAVMSNSIVHHIPEPRQRAGGDVAAGAPRRRALRARPRAPAPMPRGWLRWSTRTRRCPQGAARRARDARAPARRSSRRPCGRRSPLDEVRAMVAPLGIPADAVRTDERPSLDARAREAVSAPRRRDGLPLAARSSATTRARGRGRCATCGAWTRGARRPAAPAGASWPSCWSAEVEVLVRGAQPVTAARGIAGRRSGVRWRRPTRPRSGARSWSRSSCALVAAARRAGGPAAGAGRRVRRRPRRLSAAGGRRAGGDRSPRRSGGRTGGAHCAPLAAGPARSARGRPGAARSGAARGDADGAGGARRATRRASSSRGARCSARRLPRVGRRGAGRPRGDAARGPARGLRVADAGGRRGLAGRAATCWCSTGWRARARPGAGSPAPSPRRRPPRTSGVSRGARRGRPPRARGRRWCRSARRRRR